jgi:hypothetical protein
LRVRCRLLDLGSSHTAGSAPVSPEVDEHGDARVLDDLVEELDIGGDRLVDGSEVVFAVAAATGIGKMVGGNAIFLATVRAGSDKGHGGSAPDELDAGLTPEDAHRNQSNVSQSGTGSSLGWMLR